MELNSQSDACPWEKDETSETDSSNGVQMMSLSTPEDSDEQNLKIDDDLPSNEDPEDEIEESVPPEEDRKAYNVSYSLAMRCGIDSDPESIVSDYSEMADPIKEHLANVQIIQKEDLDLGNTFVDSQFLVHPKLFRGSEEDEEEFNRRLRKTNYLSLAQEFAELKKVNASALPFGLHKEQYQTMSPLSDVDSGSDLDCSSSDPPGGCSLADSSEALSAPENSYVFVGGGASDCTEGPEFGTTGVSDLKNGDEVSASETGAKPENTEMNLKQLNPASEPLIKSPSTKRNEDTVACEQEVPVADAGDNFHERHQLAAPAVAPGAGRGDSALPSLEPECARIPESPGKAKSVRRKMEESVGEFDIYTVETALPQMDWQLLEEQLQKAAEEEQKKWVTDSFVNSIVINCNLYL